MSNNTESGERACMSPNAENGERACKRQRIELDSDAASSELNNNKQPRIARIVDILEWKLSERLHKVLLCIVCFELPPPNECFQCALGHLICEDCVTRLLAEGALRRNAQCPQCRTYISWSKVVQNLAVEQIIWELPKTCPDCDQQVQYKQMEQHLKVCRKRLTQCQYRCLCCCYEDSRDNMAVHEANCSYPNLSGDNLLDELDMKEGVEFVHHCYRQLSAKRLNYEDLELLWPENHHRRCVVKFQVPTVNMFEETWQLLVNMPLSPDAESSLNYALKLISTPQESMDISYFLTFPSRNVNGKQLSDLNQELLSYRFTFSGESSHFYMVPTVCQMATYRLLAMPKIVLRLWMMLD